MVFLGAVAFIPFLGNAALFDWDEVNFAEISREMVVLGDFLRIHINFGAVLGKATILLLAASHIDENIRRRRIRCALSECDPWDGHAGVSLQGRKADRGQVIRRALVACLLWIGPAAYLFQDRA